MYSFYILYIFTKRNPHPPYGKFPKAIHVGPNRGLKKGTGRSKGAQKRFHIKGYLVSLAANASD